MSRPSSGRGIEILRVCRNPFVNQVFGVDVVQKTEATAEEFGRNPFVNQVFGVAYVPVRVINSGETLVAIPS